MKYSKFLVLGLVGLSLVGCSKVGNQETQGTASATSSVVSTKAGASASAVVAEGAVASSEESSNSAEASIEATSNGSGEVKDEATEGKAGVLESNKGSAPSPTSTANIQLTQKEKESGEIKADTVDTSTIPTKGTAVSNPEIKTESDKAVESSNSSVTAQLEEYNKVIELEIPLDDAAYKVFDEPTIQVKGTAVTTQVAKETSKVSLDDITGNEKELRSKVVNAALAQLGDTQDCTFLATRSIASVGVNFHGWPKDYKQLGKQVSRSEAKPGDLVIYDTNGQYFLTGQWAGQAQSHIAVYIGDGKAVHGGWSSSDVSHPEAGTTAVWSVDIPGASEPLFYSLDAYNN